MASGTMPKRTRVVGLFERGHGKRGPHPRQLHLILPQRVEFRVERGEVLVAPVPDDLADADALEHLGALTGAAA